IRKMGFDMYVDIHVVVDGGLPVKEGHAIAHRVKDALRAAMPRVADVLVHVEPAEDGRLVTGRPGATSTPTSSSNGK
ncbi:MAG: hypothetical protein HYY18_04840, partial [Planctomycetes bacterium]|nr:hypothetical protein [Planctomycetota bacterium]